MLKLSKEFFKEKFKDEYPDYFNIWNCKKKFFVSIIYLDNIKNKSVKDIIRQTRIFVKRIVKQEHGYNELFNNRVLGHVSYRASEEIEKLDLVKISKEYNNISFFIFINFDNEEVGVKLNNFENEDIKIEMNKNRNLHRHHHRNKFTI